VDKWSPGVPIYGSVVLRPVVRVSCVALIERERLQYFLDEQRGAVLAIIEGLTETQLDTPVLPSGWTPADLVLHLAQAEKGGSKASCEVSTLRCSGTTASWIRRTTRTARLRPSTPPER
jgi:Protein of unknown function (DUF664)